MASYMDERVRRMTSIPYALMRSVLFRLEPERAHHLALSLLEYVPERCFSKSVASSKAVRALGLKFSHPVGLAAGLDKNGDYIDALAKLGFSFIELGTVTPKPQEGNPKPRMFRLPKAQALINRMGFNNRGVDALIANVMATRYQGILGINIGKNAETPIQNALDDYLECLRKVYLHASYVTINISSPNTPNLRDLHGREYFGYLMVQLREAQQQLADIHQCHVPIVIKLSPDEADESLKRMADTIVNVGIDGIMVTNTTIAREAVIDMPHGHEGGGLSGQPLFTRSTDVLRIIKPVVGKDVTLIGVGGIDSPETARQKLQAGAALVQVYTGLIYQGPGLVKQLVDFI